MSKNISLYAIHGFLGLPSDWEAIFPNLNKKIETIYVDPYNFAAPKEGLWKWAENFNKEIVKKKSDELRILLGYSLGGRLSMHALLQNPSLWDAAILVSCDPGMNCDIEKANKSVSDEQWSARFKSDPWETLMKDWNSQKVFCNSTFTFIRNENNCSRNLLSETTIHWSTAKQEDLQPKLNKLSIPLFWIAGKEDQKYVGLLSGISLQNINSDIWIAPNAGHRIPWEKTEAFRNKIEAFINRIKGVQ
jgi:2-succinyl-6-hydroxy-2,4-cyclohexadiene-1-carboxylate synthase